MNPILVLRGLAQHYRHPWTLRKIPIIQGLDLEVREGEILGLLGPNGAGKTTTFRTLLGLTRPTAGEVLFCGGPLDREARGCIGFLPEQPYFYDHLTVEETLMFYGRLYGLTGKSLRDAARRVMEMLDIEPRRRSPLGVLSKGTLQRVGVAQAVLHGPRLVILDEPMSGLDPLGRRRMREVILDLRRSGATVVFSSHILPDVEALCDRVAILVGGRLREIVDRRELTPEGYRLTVETVSPEALRAIEAIAAGAPQDAENGQWTILLPDIDAVQRAVDAVRENGGRVLGLTPFYRSLEERFLRDLDGAASD